MIQALRVAPALFLLLLVGGLVSGAPASAAPSCPTETFLRFDRLAYEATSIPATVQLAPGSRVGGGTVDEPTSADGCHRTETPVQVLAAGSIEPQVAVLVGGRSRSIFVIGHRCAGFAGSSYWDCLLQPLVFHGQQFTGTSYPSQPTPRKTVPLGAAIGTANYHGHTVTVRRLRGVDPGVAVGISGRPSEAFLSPRTCPYSGFSNTPQDDNLLRCLQSPVWFTFDPPGLQAGGTVLARSDRPLPAAVAGATISLIRLSVVADLVPQHSGPLAVVGRVGEQVSLRVPNVPAGLYEAVVSCARCTSPIVGGGTLYPAGSILVSAKPKTSLGIQIVSYVLPIAFVVAAILSFMTWRRRRRQRAASSGSAPARS